jgi:hypothetical protein
MTLSMHVWLRRTTGAAVLVGAAWAMPAAVADAQPGSGAISAAETLLFDTDHLATVAAPAVLVYTFHRTSSVEPGFDDEVRLDLAPPKDKSKGKPGATLHFLTGKRAHEVPVLEDVRGNPVLLGFLERDIAEMKRLTGGSTGYFRKRIRVALAEGAQVKMESIAWQGKKLPARVVRIQPYLDDPLHAKFEPYVHKTYVFVLSEQVPGGVFQLRSSLENGNGKEAALPKIDETLTLASIAHPKR